MCVGNTRYGWNMDNGLASLTYTSETLSDSTRLNFAKTSSGNCNDPISPSAKNLLDDNLMVQFFKVSRIGTSNSFKIVLAISPYDNGQPADFFTKTGIDALCRPGKGDQFCSLAKIDTVVTARN